jgi:hypothetical protein
VTNQDDTSSPAWAPPPWFASLTRALDNHDMHDERLALGVLTTEP